MCNILTYKFVTGLLMVLHLFFNSLSCEDEQDSKITEIEEVFSAIDENHSKLRQLFESVLLKTEHEERSNCVCVPFYLCYDGVIAKDGNDLLESRFQREVCPDQVQICCKKPIFKTPTSTCGYRGKISYEENNFDSETAKYGESPWTAVVLQNDKNYQCVGSIIHPQVVLTAAHCINSEDNYTVRAGEWDFRNTKEPLPHQTESVQRVIKHPNFNIHNLFYDVALLVLEKPFQLAENVKVTCLTESAPYPLETNYDKCVATGWGLDKATGRYKRIMKKIEFSLILREQCERSLRKTRLGGWFELHRTFICGYGQNELDVCKGDGGGPLICPIPGKPEQYQQVGITSWGIGCGESLPSVFTKIAQIRNWIDTQFDILHFTKDYQHDVEDSPHYDTIEMFK